MKKKYRNVHGYQFEFFSCVKLHFDWHAGRMKKRSLARIFFVMLNFSQVVVVVVNTFLVTVAIVNHGPAVDFQVQL